MEKIYRAIIANPNKVIKLRINKEIFSVAILTQEKYPDIPYLNAVVHDLQSFRRIPMSRRPVIFPEYPGFYSEGWEILLEHAVNSIIQSDFPDDRLLFGYYLSLPINSPLVMKHLNECLKFLSTPFPIELLNYKPDSRMVSVY